MGCRQRRFIVATAVVCAVAAPATSDAEAERIALRYEAYPGCPNRREFEARIVALTQKASFSETGRRQFRIRLEQDSAGVVGHLEILAEADSGSREVRGKSCDEVAAALALITALAVDPNALGGRAEEPGLREPKRATEPPATAEPDRQRERVGTIRIARAAVTPRPGFVVSAGTAAATKTGVAPDPLLELRVFTELSFGGSLAPALRGAFEYSPDRESTTDTVRSRFGALGGSIDASLSLLSIGEVAFSWLLGAELERVRAEALDLELARPQTRFWLAAFSGPRISLELPGLSYHSHRPGVFLELQADAIVPLTRQSYFVATPSREQRLIHENPPWGFRGSAGLGLRFL